MVINLIHIMEIIIIIVKFHEVDVTYILYSRSHGRSHEGGYGG